MKLRSVNQMIEEGILVPNSVEPNVLEHSDDSYEIVFKGHITGHTVERHSFHYNDSDNRYIKFYLMFDELCQTHVDTEYFQVFKVTRVEV